VKLPRPPVRCIHSTLALILKQDAETAKQHFTMKYKITLLLLIISFINGLSQNNDSIMQLLEPLDWEIMSCGKSELEQEDCTLYIINETDKPIQGYWISNTNLLIKVNYGFIDANQSKEWESKVDNYWVFSDLNNNALGVYKTLPEHNKIIINNSNFANTRKLPTNIVDKAIHGRISGGFIIEEQAAYDVIQYDIKMEIFPDKKYIKATNTISTKVTAELNNFVFDLDTLLKVQHVFSMEGNTKVPLNAKFQKGKFWCKLPKNCRKGDTLKVCVEYEGNPRCATHAPYQGGFSWNKTENCQHWIATSCQIDGADLWFPCKDYQWDEPDSVKLSFTVPNGLKAISNGILKDTINNSNHTTTYIWEVSNPINNYCITLDIAPYVQLTDNYVSIYGDSINISYWVLPENMDEAKQFYPNVKTYLNFIETTIGPYPFRKEKLGFIEVPFVGMEHQTIIAYGPNYSTKYPGYNYVLFHELCHEWFGNMITAYDWNDFWIQEGLTGYMEALYEEHLKGEEGYKKKMDLRKRGIMNKVPLALDSIVNSRDGYGGDSYAKGMYLIHSLRYLIGKDNIIKVLRIFAYPDKQIEYETNGQQCRFVNTNDFFKTLEKVCGENFDWFKDVYFKNAEVPSLEIRKNEVGLLLKWITKDDLPFNMPLEIKTKDGIQKIDFVENIAHLNITRNEILEFDPNNWILFNIKE
jgi:aminopeptidase N